MSDFTYDLTTSVGQVRLELGDTVYGTGVRPDGSNFSDTELAYFLTQEGGTVSLAVARGCETLATQWANVADLTVGSRRESLGQIAERYAERAKSLRSTVVVAGYISMAFAQTDD